jgi:hypothetical protein
MIAAGVSSVSIDTGREQLREYLHELARKGWRARSGTVNALLQLGIVSEEEATKGLDHLQHC